MIVAMVALPTRLMATASAAQLSPTIGRLKRSILARFLGFRLTVRSLARLIVALAVLLFGVAAQAQIQRSIVNPSFEQPFTGARAAGLNTFFTVSNWIVVDAGEIPGWETTHPIVTNGCPTGGQAYTPVYTCTPIELWANTFLGVIPANGIVLAELNAYTSSDRKSTRLNSSHS